MSISKKTNKTYLQTIRLPILISTAIAIAVLCFVFYSWNQSSQHYQKHIFTAQYNQGLADTGAAFLGHLVEDEATDTIESIGQQLSAHQAVEKVSIYRRNGELIYQHDDGKQAYSDPVIADIAYEGNDNGYLIIYFAPTTELRQDDSSFWFDNLFIWLFGALVWLAILTLLYANRWFRRKSKTSKKAEQIISTSEQNAQLLKQLIRRNKQSKSVNISSSLVIKAQWDKLSNESNNKLLRILNRWLPQNGLFATHFSDGILILGLTQSHEPMKRNPLYALDYCFNQLQLEAKVIVHRLDFGRDIYQMFFDIIEPGVWFEKRLIETGSHYNWPTQKTIDIELEDQTVVELCQLKEPDAEQRGLIERQIRFLIED